MFFVLSRNKLRHETKKKISPLCGSSTGCLCVCVINKDSASSAVAQRPMGWGAVGEEWALESDSDYLLKNATVIT